MQVFKAFMKVLKKRIIYALMYICIFLGIAIPMSLNSQNPGSTKEMFNRTSKSKIAICIYDEDNTPESRAFTEYLAEKYKIKDIKNDEEVIMDSLYYSNVDRFITVNNGFSEKLANGEVDGIIDSRHMHESYDSMLLEQDLNAYFSAASAYIAGGEDALTASEKAAEALMTDAEVNILSFSSAGSENYPSDFSQYYRYMAYILIAAVIGTLCPVLMAMNKKELRFRTNCSCLRLTSYSKQILLGSGVFVLGVWLVFVVAGMILYGGIYHGRAWLAVLNSLIYAMVSATITILISTFCTNMNIINFVNQIISLGMSFLCGVFVEQEFLGNGILAVSRFLPAFWYIKANAVLDGTEVYDTAKLIEYMAIEAAFAVVIALVTFLIIKVRYSSTSLRSKPKEAVAN